MTVLANISTTIVLAFDRVITICSTGNQCCKWTIRRAKCFLVVMFVLSVLYNIVYYPIFFLDKGEVVFIIYLSLGRPILYCIIPLLILIVSTIILIVKLRRLNKSQSILTRQQRHKNNITCLLIALLSAFIVCSIAWPTFIIIGLIQMYMDSYDTTESNYVLTSVWFFHILNSSINFVVYTGCSRYYRKRMLSAMCFRFLCARADDTQPDVTNLETMFSATEQDKTADQITTKSEDTGGFETTLSMQESERSGMIQHSTPSEVNLADNSETDGSTKAEVTNVYVSEDTERESFLL